MPFPQPARAIAIVFLLGLLPGVARGDTDIQPVQIIFDLESSFLQAVPHYNAKNLDPSELIEVDHKTYAIAPDTQKVLARLLRDKRVSLAIESSFPSAEAQKILDSIYLDASHQKTLGSVVKIIIARDDADKVLPQGCANLNRCVWVTDDSAPAPTAGHIVRSGPNYFQFDTFKQAQADEAESKKHADEYEKIKTLFPPSEDALTQHARRMDAVYYPIEKALADSSAGKSDFSRALDGQVKASPAENARLGASDLSRTYDWKTTAGRVSGCVSNKQSVDLSFCLDDLPTHLAWTGNPRSTCSWVTSKGDVAKAESVDTCIAALKTYHLWVEKELDRCGVFNEFKTLVKSAPRESCTTDVVCDIKTGILSSFAKNLANEVLFKTLKSLTDVDKLDCNDPIGQPVTADDSPNRKLFENLLARGMTAPIEDFLQLWYPQRLAKHPGEEPFFFHCEATPWGALQVADKSCQPEVLYSWGPPQKVAALKNSAADGRSWEGSANPGAQLLGVYTSLDPASTFSYGQIPIRFKIKPDQNYTSSVLAVNQQHVITYRQDLITEFSFTDPDVLDSWSYGTPELYDEIVRGIQRIASGERAIAYGNTAAVGAGLNRLYSVGMSERSPQNEMTLKTNLLELIRTILKGEGRIFYSQGACRNRAQHFDTTKPTYFSP